VRHLFLLHSKNYCTRSDLFSSRLGVERITEVTLAKLYAPGDCFTEAAWAGRMFLILRVNPLLRASLR